MTNTSDITVIYHLRKKFYFGKEIYWWEFFTKEENFDFTDLIPGGFLNIPFTLYYEFGGSHQEALKNLTYNGFTDIIEAMSYKLFLDDIRSPINVGLVGEWIIVRSYNEFVKTITEKGLPEKINFDHDLALEHYVQTFDYSKFKEKTGYDCVKWLIEYCMNNNQSFPEYQVHSMNPVGKENIISLIESFKKSQTEKIL